MAEGHLSIDNNRAERAIKPLVIGRKNWLFSTNPNEAEVSTILYSIVETAKAEPNIDALLPWNFKH